VHIPTIKFTVNKPKILQRKTWRKILKRSWFETGRYWHRVILRKHFTRAGAREYNYQERTTEYKRRKKNKKKGKGENRPLVFTGALKRAAERVRDLRTTAGGVVVHLRGLPSYVKMRPAGFASPYMAEELTKISSNDRDQLEAVLDRNIEKNIKIEQRSARFSTK